MRLILLTFILLKSIYSFAQRNYVTENSIWLDGRIYTKKGEVFTGELNYNFITEVLSLKNGRESIPFSARSVQVFEVFGDSVNRKFWSLPFFNKKKKMRIPAFYEVIFESDRYAILSKHSFKEKTGSYNYEIFQLAPRLSIYMNNNVMMERVDEIIYLANSNGDIIEFGERKKSKSFHVDNDDTYYPFDNANPDKSFEESKTKVDLEKKYEVFADKKSLERVLKNDYKISTDFLKERKYKLKRLSELIELLQFLED